LAYADGVEPLRASRPLAWRQGRAGPAERMLAEEVPVALTYGRVSHAVMLATPADLEAFAIGFSLAEGIIDTAAEIVALEVLEVPGGIELRMELVSDRQARLDARRRHLAGFGGCGLCGMESLAEVLRRPAGPAPDPGWRIGLAELAGGIAALPAHQVLNRAARAVHAAGLLVPGRGIVAAAEDVGRHNALDKLAGRLARAGIAATVGAVLLSSRVSVELVQKAARLGAPLIAAVSAPTTLALRVAEAAGIAVVGIARDDGFEVFTHPERVRF
jgi:FdhD protein